VNGERSLQLETFICWQWEEMSANLHAGCPAGNKAECCWSASAGESVESEVDWRGSWWRWWSVWWYHHRDVPGML